MFCTSQDSVVCTCGLRGEKEHTFGSMQITNFLPFVGHFSPRRAKNDLQKKESTMLPQAKTAFA